MLTIQIPVGQTPVGEPWSMDQNTRREHKGANSLNLCSAECQGLRQSQLSTENRRRTHTESQDKIEIPDAERNRTRATGLKGRDSIDNAAETKTWYPFNKMLIRHKKSSVAPLLVHKPVPVVRCFAISADLYCINGITWLGLSSCSLHHPAWFH